MPLPEDAEAQWWARWWSLAPNWDHLRYRELAGRGGEHGATTLQDYWRRDPATGVVRDNDQLLHQGELVEGRFAGDLWHIAHVPMHWQDGSPAKAGWTPAQVHRLVETIAARLAAARATRVTAGRLESTVKGRDRRAQLARTVLPRLPSALLDYAGVWHLTAAGAWLPEWIQLDARFGPGADFRRAWFGGRVELSDAHFADADFGGAAFTWGASMRGSRFAGPARFGFARLGGDGSFNGCRFDGDARFDVVDAGDVSLYEARFGGDLELRLARLSGTLDLSGATVGGSLDARDLETGGEVWLDRLRCQGRAQLTAGRHAASFSCVGARFRRGADFSGSTIAGAANFSRTRFGDAARHESTGFNAVVFGDTANFSRVRFSGDTKFAGANWTGAADFSHARFGHMTSFDDARFTARASFERSDFRQRRRGRIVAQRCDFARAVFAGAANFNQTTFDPSVQRHAAGFAGARFLDIADFRAASDLNIAMFDEAEFDKRLLLDDPPERQAIAAFDKLLPEVRRAGSNLNAGETYLHALEGGARAVKTAMGKTRNELIEQRYYRFQLKARRYQPGTPWLEKASSAIYAFVSDYGLSLTRPLAGVVLVFALFAAIYAAVPVAPATVAPPAPGAAAPAPPPPIPDALSMSASRMFPFGAFEGVSTRFLDAAERAGGRGATLGVRVLASLQSLAAATLLFLFVLAVRRRFQVS